MLIFLALDLELYDENDFFENYHYLSSQTYWLITPHLRGPLTFLSDVSMLSPGHHLPAFQLLAPRLPDPCIYQHQRLLLHLLILRIGVPAISPFLPLKPREEGPPLAYVSLAFFGLDLLAFHGLPCVVSSPACYLSLFLFSELCFLTCCFS